MYEFIQGVLRHALPGVAVIEAGGFGYRLSVPLSTSAALGRAGDEVMLLLHHTLNPDSGEQRLYGFLTEHERRLFRALLDVKGIGPATALTVLCTTDADNLIGLIARGDAASLKKFKGIGPKSAERIVAELRDKVAAWGAPVARGSGAESAEAAAGTVAEDAVLALVALGFPAAKSEQAVSRAIDKLTEGASVEDLVRQALQLV